MVNGVSSSENECQDHVVSLESNSNYVSIKKREKRVPLDGKVAVGRELGEQDVDDALLLPTLYEVMIVVNPKHVALVDKVAP